MSTHALALLDHGHYTTDAAAGLDWLDMSYTRGDSYVQVQQRIGGGDLDGWRIATSAEFDELVANAIGGPYTPGFDPAQFDAMVGLIGLLDQTYGYDYYAYAVGFVDSTGLPMADARQFGFHEGAGGYVRPPNDYNWDDSFNSVHSQRGVFLVRTSSAAIPEPPMLALIGAALLALGVSRRRV